MDNDNLLDSNISDEFVVTEAAWTYLTEIAKWARFLAIVGFIFLVVLVIIALFMGSIMGATMSEIDDEAAGAMGALMGGGMTALYLLMAALYFFPTWYLYRFATRTKQALASSDSELLAGGLEQLKSCFKFMGILMIIVLAFYALGIVFAIIGISAAGL